MKTIPIQNNTPATNNVNVRLQAPTIKFVEITPVITPAPILARQAHVPNFLASTRYYLSNSETDRDGEFTVAEEVTRINPNDPINLTGKTLGDAYQIQEYIGKGGMSYVYKALNTRTNDYVAVKFIKNLSKDSKKVFFREIGIMKRLQSKNILKIYSFGSENKMPYLVAEFMNGGTLREPKINLSLEQKILILADICDALHYMHDNNIIHRDIKPENILLSNELTDDEYPIRPTAKLADFGLAITPEKTNTDKSNVISGSVLYMSPEQANGESNLNGLSDLYSIGIILYELLTGKVPFDGEGNLVSLLDQQKSCLPIAPSKINMKTLPELELIIMTLLQKNPEHRYYKSACDLAKDLRDIVSTKTID